MTGRRQTDLPPLLVGSSAGSQRSRNFKLDKTGFAAGRPRSLLELNAAPPARDTVIFWPCQRSSAS